MSRFVGTDKIRNVSLSVRTESTLAVRERMKAVTMLGAMKAI